MKLVLPSLKYREEYLAALKETKDEAGETKLNRPDPDQTFEEFVQMWLDHSQGKNLREGTVPATMYWLVDKGELIGRAHIRHELNDFLLTYGGHIGYYIKPSKRKMGYGTKILELGLEKAKEIGISKVLVTCDTDNVGSQKVIEACGGVLENIFDPGDGKPPKMRYWIDQNNISSNS